jgi:hypothetical protein
VEYGHGKTHVSLRSSGLLSTLAVLTDSEEVVRKSSKLVVAAASVVAFGALSATSMSANAATAPARPGGHTQTIIWINSKTGSVSKTWRGTDAAYTKKMKVIDAQLQARSAISGNARIAPLINTVGCGSRTDFFKVYYGGRGQNTRCYANSGSTSPNIWYVDKVTSGNNSGYFDWVVNAGGPGVGKSFAKWVTIICAPVSCQEMYYLKMN